MRRAPEDGDDRQRGKRRRRESRGELTAAAAARRPDQRDGADAKRQRRDADQRGQQTPDNEEDAHKIDV